MMTAASSASVVGPPRRRGPGSAGLRRQRDHRTVGGLL